MLSPGCWCNAWTVEQRIENSGFMSSFMFILKELKIQGCAWEHMKAPADSVCCSIYRYGSYDFGRLWPKVWHSGSGRLCLLFYTVAVTPADSVQRSYTLAPADSVYCPIRLWLRHTPSIGVTIWLRKTLSIVLYGSYDSGRHDQRCDT